VLIKREVDLTIAVIRCQRRIGDVIQDIGCAFDRIADLLTPDLAAGNIYSPFEGVRRALWQIEAV